MRNIMSKATVTLAVLTLLGAYASFANAQTSIASTSDSIPRPGTGKWWWVNFDDKTVKTVRAASTEYDPVIILQRADGSIISTTTGTRSGNPAEVRLHGNPGSLGWVKVWVGASGSGTGAFHFSISERPFVPPVVPPVVPPPPPPPPPQGGTNMTVVLKWTPKVDLDLWVKEPGSRDWIYYGKRKGAGTLSPDDTDGGSNSVETYTVTNGPAGSYEIKVNFFGDYRTPAEGRGNQVTFELNVVRNGVTTVNESRSLRAVRDDHFGPITQ